MGCQRSRVEISPDIEVIATRVAPTSPQRGKAVTNVGFLVLFVMMFCSMGFIAFYSLENGDPARYTNGVDSWGNVCGRKENKRILGAQRSGMDHSSRPYAFHMSISDAKSYINPWNYLDHSDEIAVICVKKCPTRKTSCQNILTTNGYFFSPENLVNQVCKNINAVVPHAPLANRCVPLQLTKETGTGVFSMNSLRHIIISFTSYKKDVFHLTLICFGISLLYILVFQLITTLASLIITVTAGVSSVATTIYLFFIFSSKKRLVNEHEAENSEMTFALLRDSNYILFFAIVSMLFTIAMPFLLLLVLYKKRKRTLDLFKEAAFCLSRLPALALQPVITLLCKLTVIIYFICVGIHILTCHDTCVNNQGVVRFVEKRRGTIAGVMFVHAFGCLWMLQFISACHQVAVAGAIVRWFFSRGATDYKVDYPCKYFPAIPPIQYLISHNLGTIALGSLIMPILQIGRDLITFIYQEIRKRRYKESPEIPKGCRCCVWWCQNVLKYITQYNYVSVAMYGCDFWTSGRKSIVLFSRIRHMELVRLMCSVCLIIWKLTLIFVTFLACSIWFSVKHGTDSSSSDLIATTIVCIISYIFTASFLNLYSITLNAVYLCYCEDKRRNNGSSRPFYSRFQLIDIMAKTRRTCPGWSDQSLMIPMQERNDPRIYVPPRPKRQRPRAAKGKRGAPGEIRTISPREPFDIDAISWDGSVQVVVDRFDIFVDQMMHDSERSPLSKRREKKENSKTHTPLPPINQPRTAKASYSFPELALLDFSDDEADPNSQTNGKEDKNTNQARESEQLPHLTKPSKFLPSGSREAEVTNEDSNTPNKKKVMFKTDQKGDMNVDIRNPAEPVQTTTKKNYLNSFRSAMKQTDLTNLV